MQGLLILVEAAAGKLDALRFMMDGKVVERLGLKTVPEEYRVLDFGQTSEARKVLLPSARRDLDITI